jgi:hypothetical protein
MYTKIFTVFLLFLSIGLSAQISINTDDSNPDASAILDVKSTSLGVLVPRMTTTQRNLISSPATGLLVFDTTTGSFWFYNGSWIDLSSSLSDADNDTKIQVEESGDEDKIRFDMAGTEHFTMSAGRLEVLNTGSSVFIGEGAGANDDLSNNNNTFVGYQAGNTNTTGSYNTANGYQALYFNTTGYYNTANGSSALKANTTGVFNTAYGFESGYNNQSGDLNVFLGNRAGFYETGSEKLYIDNSDTSTPLIWGDFSTNRAGINRVATTNTLEVGGNASKASAGDWLANSDARLKKNITPLSSEKMLNNLLALQGVTYEWNDDKTGNIRPEGIQYGFTAQNIEAVFPTLVDEDNTGYLQTAYGTYDAMTIEAIRALNDKITAFEKGNIDLSVQVQSLEEENEALKAQAVKINQLETMMAELQSQIQGNTEAYNSEN